jgi:hypothetical protein
VAQPEGPGHPPGHRHPHENGHAHQPGHPSARVRRTGKGES